VDCILRAFAIIQQRYPEATLTIAHDGVCRPALEKLAQELGLRNARFIGRVPHAEVASLYDAAEIYLTSPNFDCMPGSLLECYASGLPLVATKPAGFPTSPRMKRRRCWSTSTIMRRWPPAVFRLMDNPELVQQITRDAYAELEKYRPERSRDQWADLYRELMQQEVPAPEARRG